MFASRHCAVVRPKWTRRHKRVWLRVMTMTSRPVKFCGICHDMPVFRNKLCSACWWYRQRNGTDRPMARLHDHRPARKASTVPRREEPDEDTITYGDWCRSNGYDPERHRYSQ